MTLHHVICYVTTVMCLFIINKKKRNIKSRKIDKRKKNVSVQAYHNTLPVKIVDGGLYFIFPFSVFIFIFLFFSFLFTFLFLEQLGLGLIGHAVTSVTS